ncbi:MAG: serine/threonine protein kinase, partial [Pseudanabaenales cyanobacterium]|nr:serine/threonine protein kinase [Pseudanabaenales cyanobacterium]
QVEIEEQRVQFPEGRDGILVSNSVGPGRIRRYIVNARQGQILFLQLRDLSGPATLAVRLPGGELLDDASRALFWEGNLPVGGDFKVDVSSPTPSEFTLDIRVKN